MAICTIDIDDNIINRIIKRDANKLDFCIAKGICKFVCDNFKEDEVNSENFPSIDEVESGIKTLQVEFREGI